MKRLIFLAVLSFFSLIAICQKTVELKDIKNHIGENVTVVGKVTGTKYFENAKGAPTLLNLGGLYPNQLLTVVISGDDRKNFKNDPEVWFKDKVVSVTGKVELFKEKPQIVVHSPSDISSYDNQKEAE